MRPDLITSDNKYNYLRPMAARGFRVPEIKDGYQRLSPILGRIKLWLTKIIFAITNLKNTVV